MNDCFLSEEMENDFPFTADVKLHQEALNLFDKDPAAAYEFVRIKMDAEQRSIIPDEIQAAMLYAHLQSKSEVPLVFGQNKRGSIVAHIQRFLGINDDGIFGPNTAAAVREFQKGKGLLADGLVGKNTWAALLGQQTGQSCLHESTEATEVRSEFPLEDKSGASLRDFYGEPGTENLVRVIPPYQLYYNGQKVSSVRLHQKVAESFMRVMRAVLEAYGPEEIKRLRLDQYGGSYNDRNIRGGSRKSTHAWGIALDFDPQNNQLKWDHTKATFAKPEYQKWWECWEAEGWYSLGRNHDYDWMHIQAARRGANS